MNRKLAIIADDLSSATDCGIQVARSGLETTVLLGEALAIPAGSDPEVLSLDLDSRAVPPETAYRRAFEAARFVTGQGYPVIYKSVDSTLRGNLGAEVDGALDAAPVDLAIVAPAYPLYGRQTRGGLHTLHGRPIHTTEFGTDPQAPVRQSDLLELLAGQSRRRASLVGLETLRRGAQAVKESLDGLRGQGIELAVFDVEVEGDLDAVVQAVAASGCRVLWVGSTGLARCIPQALAHPASTRRPAETRSIPGGPILLVAGSASETTRAQVSHFCQALGASGVAMDPLPVIRGGMAAKVEADRCAQSLLQTLRTGQNAALWVRSTRADVAETQALGAGRGLNPMQVAGRILEALSGVAARLAEETHLPGMILTGGDTAKAVCEALRGSGIQILAEVEPGIPLARLLGPLSLLIVTKAGGFGTPEALVKAYQLLQKG